MEHLARPEREVLVLSLLGGRSFREIAAITGREPAAVVRLASRGLAALADELGPLLAQTAPAAVTAGAMRAPGPQGVTP